MHPPSSVTCTSTGAWRTATRLKAVSAAKVKTDKVDSDVLARLLGADLIPEAHMIGRDQRGPRDLLGRFHERTRAIIGTHHRNRLRNPRE